VHCVRPGVTKESWVPWNSQKAVSNLGDFLEKSVPCALLMWAEWWCAEIMTLMAGYLGVIALAAHTAVLQVFVLIYMTAGGIACAGAALVGNAIGGGQAALAKKSAVFAVGVMLVSCVVFNFAIVLGADAIVRAFSTGPEVGVQIRLLLNLLLLVVPLDALQTVIDGILRGLGKQAFAFKVKLLCMWGIRLPLAYYLSFQEGFGVEGIWFGSAAGLGATMVVYTALIFTIDWESEAISAATAYKFSTDDIEIVYPLERKESWVVPSPTNSSHNFAAVPGLCRSPSMSWQARKSTGHSSGLSSA